MFISLFFWVFVSQPSAAALQCKVPDYRIATDSDDTRPIQAAIDACQGKNGTVLLPAGEYHSATLRLGSQMTIHLDKGATLHALHREDAFPDLNPPSKNGQLSSCRRALLYAPGAKNLVIEGPGTVEGGGDYAPWLDVPEAKRPMAIFTLQTDSLRIRNLRVEKSAMWSVVLMEAKHARVSHVAVESLFGNTRDGIDLVDGLDIHVEDVDLTTEDDSICLKSGLPSGLQDVWIRRARIHQSSVANGLKFGTASIGPLRRVHFEDISIEHVSQAAMALESVDGSKIDHVSFKNIRLHDTGTAFFVLLGWRGNQTQAKPGSIAHISFENISGDTGHRNWGSVVSGTLIGGKTYAPEGLLFRKVHLQVSGGLTEVPAAPPEYNGDYPDPRMWPPLPARGVFFRHVNRVQWEEGLLEPLNGEKDARPFLSPPLAASPFSVP